MNEDRRPYRVWPVLLASGLVFLVLCGLGTWQVYRLQWKNGLIAEIDRHLAAPPVSPSQALAMLAAGEDINYLVVAAKGHFIPGTELLKLTSHEGSPGFSVVAPFVSDDGVGLLVDRGTIPEELVDPNLRPETLPAEVKGYLLVHGLGQGYFDPENDPAQNRWYWWDVPAMLGAARLPPDAKVANVILHRLPGTSETTPPIAPKAKADLRNNHLGYAITWFGLAATLVAVTAVFLTRPALPEA